VRQWLVDTATAQRNEHIKANLPYADLMFALGFATLGDSVSARELLESARRVMEGAIPEGGTPWADQAVTAAVVRNFLFKAFKYRIEQALAGKLHVGLLSAEVLADRKELAKRAGVGPVNNPYKLAEYAVDRLREQLSIIEPQEKPDPYAVMPTRNVLRNMLAELHTIPDPAEFAERVRQLYQKGLPGKNLAEVQFLVLFEALPLATRVGEAFAVEQLELVPATIAAGTGQLNESPDMPQRKGKLLASAFFLASHFNREAQARKLLDTFLAVVWNPASETRVPFTNAVMGVALACLKKLGLRDQVNRLLNSLHGEMLRGTTLEDLKQKHVANPEQWSAVLQTLLNLAGGWLMLGQHERAEPILAEVRNELLGAKNVRTPPKEYTELARTYVAALGAGPTAGLDQIAELFREMPLNYITNIWNTAQYYSRFHLCLVEDTVAAVCRMLAQPQPHIVG
ncbi:MAG: hypothetical protein L0241_13705, partial [Planctomycetia bacterium]|nr:hypothetical protein [Planctomycetia bacterium]